MVQYKFVSIINQTENATLLNYEWLDMGVYTVTGITSNIRFFEQQNIRYSEFPLNMDEQNRYIKEKLVDFIVLQRPSFEILENLNIPYLYENYQLIGSEKQAFENIEFNYLLFKKIK